MCSPGPFLGDDAVLAVKDALVVPLGVVDDPAAAGAVGMPCPYLSATFDIVLVPAPPTGGAMCPGSQST